MADSSWPTGDESSWDPVNDFLVNCLDRIDARLLGYLDTHSELTLTTVRRLRLYVRAMLDGSMTPSQVRDEWADWFLLAPAFVAAYGTLELADLEGDASLLRSGGVEENASLTDADRVYLRALEVVLETYTEMGTVQ